MKQHEDNCLFTSIIKDQTAKARSLGIKCVPLLDINWHWWVFFGNTLSITYIVLTCCYEIPRNLSYCQSPYFRWKLVGLFFLRFLGWKWKLCRDQSRLTFLSRGFAARFCARSSLCSNVSLLAGYWFIWHQNKALECFECLPCSHIFWIQSNLL